MEISRPLRRCCTSSAAFALCTVYAENYPSGDEVAQRDEQYGVDGRHITDIRGEFIDHQHAEDLINSQGGKGVFQNRKKGDMRSRSSVYQSCWSAAASRGDSGLEQRERAE